MAFRRHHRVLSDRRRGRLSDGRWNNLDLPTIWQKGVVVVMEDKPVKVSVFAVPPQLEFHPTGRRIQTRNGDRSLAEFLAAGSEHRLRRASQERQAQLTVSSCNLDYDT
jgi:hypothetical protein